jgi:hypothetical protein
MAGHFNPFVPPPFDLSRDYVLSAATPPIQIANAVTNSTTRSTYRLHWNRIQVWEDFGTRVHHYWNNVVLQVDKQHNVYHAIHYSGRVRTVAFLGQVANEGNVKGCISEFFVPLHSAAANGSDGAPRPSDIHSVLQRWEQGVEAHALGGIPDFVMASALQNPPFPRRITALFEVKNPWQVTPALIDDVINGLTFATRG